jgi:hypothetical protein
MEKVEVELTGKITHETGSPVSIEVTRGQRGSYGWTIKVAGTDPEQVREKVREIDNKLRTDFPQQEGGTG